MPDRRNSWKTGFEEADLTILPFNIVFPLCMYQSTRHREPERVILQLKIPAFHAFRSKTKARPSSSWSAARGPEINQRQVYSSVRYLLGGLGWARY